MFITKITPIFGFDSFFESGNYLDSQNFQEIFLGETWGISLQILNNYKEWDYEKYE